MTNVISQKAKYAFKALVVLARQEAGTSLQTTEIATAAAMPRKFLEQILLQLKASGLVTAAAAAPAAICWSPIRQTITVSQVLRIVDGPIAPLTCISRTAYSRCKDCPDETHCAVRRLFAETYASTLDRMEKTTLAGRACGPAAVEPTGAARRSDLANWPTQSEFPSIGIFAEIVSTERAPTIEGSCLLKPSEVDRDYPGLNQPGDPT